MFKDIKEACSSNYQCCFCGESIEKNALVILNMDLGDNQSQSMATHGMCIQKKLHPSIPFVAPEEICGDSKGITYT